MCQEFISVHLSVAVYTHTFIYNTRCSVVMGTAVWCLWARGTPLREGASVEHPPACTFVWREALLGELPQEPLLALLITAAYFSH